MLKRASINFGHRLLKSSRMKSFFRLILFSCSPNSSRVVFPLASSCVFAHFFITYSSIFKTDSSNSFFSFYNLALKLLKSNSAVRCLKVVFCAGLKFLSRDLTNSSFYGYLVLVTFKLRTDSFASIESLILLLILVPNVSALLCS